MWYRASQPECVPEKMRECKFFLAQMAEYEERNQIQEFLYCLSAFLSAFRSTLYRMIGVVETQHGKPAARSLWDSLKTHPDIWFLRGATDLEVHAEGPKVWQVRIASRASQRFSSRFEGRFRSRLYQQTEPMQTSTHMQFEERPTNIVRLCFDALTELEKIVQKELPASVKSLP